jgi:ferredoxin--NADP+ reductase
MTDLKNGPLFPEVKMNLVRKSAPVQAIVVSNELCTAGKSASFVKHLVLDIRGTLLEGQFAVGQSFGVVAPGTDKHGRPHKLRLYSLASPGFGEIGHPTYISTTPKRLIDEFKPQRNDDGDRKALFLGVCSNYLCDLYPGDKVALTGPNGQRFLLPIERDKHDYLFLATGTGIAPFRGMLMELLRPPSGASRSRIDLVMGTAYSTDLLYDDFFRQLDHEHENFHYHTAISREPHNGDTRGRYIHELLQRDITHFAPLLANERTLLYVCGLEGMRYGVVRTLAQHALGGGYFKVPEELQNVDPARWTDGQIRKQVKTGSRSFLEVY